MILLKAGSSSSVWFFSNGYSVEYLFMATLCLTIGVTVPISPRYPMVCSRCRISSAFLSAALIRLGMKIRPADYTDFKALTNMPVASTVSASKDMGTIAVSADW